MATADFMVEIRGVPYRCEVQRGKIDIHRNGLWLGSGRLVSNGIRDCEVSLEEEVFQALEDAVFLEIYGKNVLWRITDEKACVNYGIYLGDAKDAALDALARASKYDNYAALSAENPTRLLTVRRIK